MYWGIGIKRSQCLILGIEYPLKSGWKERLIGRQITEQQAEKYLQLGSVSCKSVRKADGQIKFSSKQKFASKQISSEEVEYTNDSLERIKNISFDDMRPVSI